MQKDVDQPFDNMGSENALSHVLTRIPVARATGTNRTRDVIEERGAPGCVAAE